jgi:hypothetical protein
MSSHWQLKDETFPNLFVLPHLRAYDTDKGMEKIHPTVTFVDVTSILSKSINDR